MNSIQQSIPAQSAGRATLGVITKLIAIIVSTFAFAAFSSSATQPQTTEPVQNSSSSSTPNQQP